jgi:hypothetical protein
MIRHSFPLKKACKTAGTLFNSYDMALVSVRVRVRLRFRVRVRVSQQ